MKREAWTREQLLLAFRVYCRMPFGKLHQHNLEIIEASELIGRTPSAVAMKACNFASLDPVHRQRNISALGNVSRADKALWEEFQSNPDMIAAEAEEVFACLTGNDREIDREEYQHLGLPEGLTEVAQTIKARRVQRFFRAAVLSSYEFRCALSGIAIPELLNASHIIPWSITNSRRADPTNGIALNALYDRAFDRGLFTFDDSMSVLLSSQLRKCQATVFDTKAFEKLEGQKLLLPSRFAPDPEAIAYHRENIFRQT